MHLVEHTLARKSVATRGSVSDVEGHVTLASSVLARSINSASLEDFEGFSSVVMQMPAYNSQRRGTASTLPN